jgi:hypothetical protein
VQCAVNAGLVQCAICQEAIAQGPLNTRQLALKVMAAKGLDTGDKVLAKAVASRLIHALRQQCRRGLIDGTEKHLGARVWALPHMGYCHTSNDE